MTQASDILERISGLADELNLASLRPQIAACRQQLHVRDSIDVAVFGRFKAGKSSFLNHLTGRAVLPIGVVPLTAVITRLRYGESERAEVRFLNGTTQAIRVEDIGLYVAENENPDNRKQVASVEVSLPALQPLAPLQFVDTPGLGSAFTHNTEAAMKWLPNVGAALVAVSSDAPLSERDLALLEELRRHTSRIVLLLTKADLLTEPQRAEVLNFVRQQLRRKWNTDLPVFFYSIQPGLVSLKAELQEKLFVPLLHHRAEAGDEIIRHKLASLVSQTLDYLRIALAAATQAESARQALRDRLAEERAQFDAFREQIHLLAHDASGRALEETLQKLLPVERDLQTRVTSELQSQFAQWRMGLPAFIAAYGKWLDSLLVNELTAVSRNQRAIFCEPLQKARLHLTRALQAFQGRLADHVRTALGLSLTPHEFNLDVAAPADPPVDVSLLFMLPMETIGYAIPMTLFRRVVERHFLARARYEVEKNLSRLAADWQQRVSAAIHKLRCQAEQIARDELATLERMLAQSGSNQPLLREAHRDMEDFQAQLQAGLRNLNLGG